MTFEREEIRFRYNRVRSGMFVLLAAGCVAGGLWQAGRTDGIERFLALALVIIAMLAAIAPLRALLDRSPAVLITPEGLAARRLGGTIIPWRDIRGVRLHWRKHTIFRVIPLNTPELALSIRLESEYWISGGFARTLMRWLSLASGDDTVVVNLNGLAGGRPDRVIAAIRRMRPDLVREIVIEDID